MWSIPWRACTPNWSGAVGSLSIPPQNSAWGSSPPGPCRCLCPPRCRSPRPRATTRCSPTISCWPASSSICGTHVHVGIADRDEAVAVGNRMSPHLPTLLALSTSSPFWSDGSDTGYSSVRTLVWQRWPTTGLAAPVHSATEYDQLVADLVASGVITDAGMVYFDVRPSNSAPTLELRVCDSCPSVETIVLIAGLFRALVVREAEEARAGTAPMVISPTLGRAALWRAARSGLEGDLVDVNGPSSRPAGEVISELVRSLRPAAGGQRRLGVDHRVDPAGPDRRHIVGAATASAAPPRPPHRRGRSADRRDRRSLAEHRRGRRPRPDPAVRLSAQQRSGGRRRA